MNDDSFQNKIKDFLPNKEELLGFDEIEKICNNKGHDITVRTIKYYITKKMLPKPIYIRNKAYFEKTFIVNELDALYILKTVFNCSLSSIAELSASKTAYLQDIVSALHQISEHEYFNTFQRDRNNSIAFRYANNKGFQYCAQCFLKRVKGQFFYSICIADFVDECIHNIAQEKQTTTKKRLGKRL